MLVTERGTELWLAPFITYNWLKDGQRLKVSNAPTRFGPVAYELESRLQQGLIHATIQSPQREPPSRIVLRLRHPDGLPIRSVQINGKRYSDYDKAAGLVRLRPSNQPLSVDVRFR